MHDKFVCALDCMLLVAASFNLLHVHCIRVLNVLLVLQFMRLFLFRPWFSFLIPDL